MYRAKASGRGGFQLYDPSMNARALDRLHLETQLRRALERREFVLHYQPKADLASGAVTGVEALLRWQRPGAGLVPPDEFIRALEERRLIVPVGAWVISAACEQLVAWDRAGLPGLTMAVNLSARQFREPDLPKQIGQILRAHGIAPSRLELELTESLLMEDNDLSREILQGFARVGVRVAIDDFGTGHSSLAYLKRFKVDTLKMDRSFVRDLPHDGAIPTAVAALARSLNLSVVCEGVETPEQLAFLQSVRCDEYQGFLTSRAIEPVEFGRMLERRAAIESAFTSLSRPAELVFSPAG
jgi:EAL domain-containing protein (putative c-di-GMP-specific phosphodiesterase class I)